MNCPACREEVQSVDTGKSACTNCKAIWNDSDIVAFWNAKVGIYTDAIKDAEGRIGSHIASGGKVEDIYVQGQIKRIHGWMHDSDIARLGAVKWNTYYFTISTHSYYVIRSTSMERARSRMFEVFGSRWAFGYTEEEWHESGVSQATKYKLKEVK